MHAKKNRVDYWPGFVDAIMNVLLNLLFMLCIMAFGLGLMQQTVRDTGDTEDPAKATPVADKSPEPLKALVLPIDEGVSQLTFSQVVLKAPAAPKYAEPENGASIKTTLSAQNVVTLEFKNNGAELSEQIKTQLNSVLPSLAKPQEHIRVWAVDTQEVENTNKLLFRRLMTVRNALLDYGIPANHIDIRMLPGSSEKNTIRVYLAFVPAPTPSNVIAE